ncbi:hypothetical protein Pelo_3052 [Pelomyxa schiedti]|nr:hypothetical protein Pelo_3052 [Pelomyxa schiedti]
MRAHLFNETTMSEALGRIEVLPLHTVLTKASTCLVIATLEDVTVKKNMVAKAVVYTPNINSCMLICTAAVGSYNYVDSIGSELPPPHPQRVLGLGVWPPVYLNDKIDLTSCSTPDMKYVNYAVDFFTTLGKTPKKPPQQRIQIVLYALQTNGS